MVRDPARSSSAPTSTRRREAVAERVAAERHATLVTRPPPGRPLRAPGGFQRENFALAPPPPRPSSAPLEPAAASAAAGETHVPGRVEVVGEDPLTVYDGAHNPAGAARWRVARRRVRRPLPAGGGDRGARGQGRRRDAARPAAPR